MQSIREIAIQLDEFIKREWPYSASYFSHLAVKNSTLISRMRSGRRVEFGTIVRALNFAESYRLDPEGTMELARANQPIPTVQNKKPARPARKGQSRSSRVAA